MKDRGDRTVVSTWPVPSGIVWSDRREGILRRFPAVSSRTQMELLRRTIVESPGSPYGWESGPIGDVLCVPRCFPAERSRGRLTAACGLNRPWTRLTPSPSHPTHNRLIHSPPPRRTRRRLLMQPRRFGHPAEGPRPDRNCPGPTWWRPSQASMTHRSTRRLKRPWPG